MIGAIASGKGEALFSIIARNEFDLVGLVPTQDIAKLAVNQTGADQDHRRRRGRRQDPPDRHHGRAQQPARPGLHRGDRPTGGCWSNSSGRALIKTGQSCGVAVPLTAILYGGAGTVVQVIRRARVETRRVEVGLMSGGQVEIREGLQEGDIVVARAGALLREGDPVRPITVGSNTN